MSLLSKPFYNMRCDRCGRILEEEEWWDKDYILDLSESGNWITHKRKHYCPDCWEYDDNDNIVIKPPTDGNV